MRVELRMAESSRPDRPLWLWRVWSGGREVAVGFEPTREEARDQLERALAVAQRREIHGGYGYWGQRI